MISPRLVLVLPVLLLLSARRAQVAASVSAPPRALAEDEHFDGRVWRPGARE